MRYVLPLMLLALLSGCGQFAPTQRLNIDTSLSAKGQDSRALFLVLHYTVANLQESIRILTEEEVSAHYLVTDEKPVRIYRLVDEDRRAWHSGPSHWRGHAMLNASSIGIEIVNPGYVDTPQGRQWVPYTPEQIDTVVALVQDIVRRHKIRPERVVGHSDVLPQYKQDPGPHFPWKRLADLGLIPWPDATRVATLRPQYEAALPDITWFQKGLATHGFLVPQNGQLDEATRNVMIAFQMKYRPAKHDGVPDAETAALLQALIVPNAPATVTAAPAAPR
jgi:N-acetylmuramoyl-L-alanine amidase